MERPDQENLNSFLEHIKSVSFGTTVIEFTVYRGLIAGWSEKETRRGHRAPLKKDHGA